MSTPAPWDDARAIIEGAGLNVPIAWPNEPFSIPSTIWMSVASAGDALIPVEIGGGIWQETGTLYIDIHVPTGSGGDEARTLAKRVVNLFRGLGARLVSYQSAAVGTGSVSDEFGNWWTMPLTVDWQYQDIST